MNNISTYYAQHIAEKIQRFQVILAEAGFDEVIIASGDTRLQFQDDLAYPFKANPYFREWAPLNRRAGCYLHIHRNSSKPSLYLLNTEDIWHTARQCLPPGYDHALTIIEYQTLDEVKENLGLAAGKASQTMALVSEENVFACADHCWNPPALLHRIDYQRCRKTLYEQHCVRQANRLAVPAHRAAQQAFMAGHGEREICAAYYAASHSCESDMPYSVIVGINEHAAVLHHNNLDKHRPETPRSLLLDAGIDFQGYASDITRTYAFDPSSEFAEMINCLDEKQQALAAAGGIGKTPVELHTLAQRNIAELLLAFGLITGSVDAALETGLVDTFFPHGLGHHLGCSVHDKGGQIANAQGDCLPPNQQYPKLRTLAPMVANQVYTVEPGVYFIPSKLADCRKGGSASLVNWPRVEAFIKYGGIRIEDNLMLHSDGQLENMTRDAFAADMSPKVPAHA